MSVVRVNKTKNFTVMSNTHFKEKKMSLKAKGLLSLMLSLPESWDYSIAGLVSLSKDGKDSVMSALAELEEFGYLTRTRTTDSRGRFSGIQYDIFEEPQRENPISENQNSDKQNAEKSNSENPPQLKTKFIKNVSNKELKELNTDNDIYKEFNSILLEINNNELRDLYKEYIDMRESIDSPMTPRGLKMLVQRCERLSNLDIELQKALVEAAVINNWKSVYLPNEQDLKNNTTLAKLKRFYSQVRGWELLWETQQFLQKKQQWD